MVTHTAAAGEDWIKQKRNASHGAGTWWALAPWLVRARDSHGAPAQSRRTWHSSEMALRVFACARGRTCSFHAVCVERVMQGAGNAWLGVWECWGARRRVGKVPEGRSLRDCCSQLRSRNVGVTACSRELDGVDLISERKRRTDARRQRVRPIGDATATACCTLHAPHSSGQGAVVQVGCRVVQARPRTGESRGLSARKLGSGKGVATRFLLAHAAAELRGDRRADAVSRNRADAEPPNRARVSSNHASARVSARAHPLQARVAAAASLV